MSQIEENKEFDEILQITDLDEFDVADSQIDEQQDTSEELLGVVSAPANDALSTSGMAPRDGRCGVLRSEDDSCQTSFPMYDI